MACDGNKAYVVPTFCKDPVLCFFDPVLLLTWLERYLRQLRAQARGEAQNSRHVFLAAWMTLIAD
jgi:hypothetical protein